MVGEGLFENLSGGVKTKLDNRGELVLDASNFSVAPQINFDRKQNHQARNEPNSFYTTWSTQLVKLI